MYNKGIKCRVKGSERPETVHGGATPGCMIFYFIFMLHEALFSLGYWRSFAALVKVKVWKRSVCTVCGTLEASACNLDTDMDIGIVAEPAAAHWQDILQLAFTHLHLEDIWCLSLTSRAAGDFCRVKLADGCYQHARELLFRAVAAKACMAAQARWRRPWMKKFALQSAVEWLLNAEVIPPELLALDSTRYLCISKAPYRKNLLDAGLRITYEAVVTAAREKLTRGLCEWIDDCEACDIDLQINHITRAACCSNEVRGCNAPGVIHPLGRPVGFPCALCQAICSLPLGSSVASDCRECINQMFGCTSGTNMTAITAILRLSCTLMLEGKLARGLRCYCDTLHDVFAVVCALSQTVSVCLLMPASLQMKMDSNLLSTPDIILDHLYIAVNCADSFQLRMRSTTCKNIIGLCKLPAAAEITAEAIEPLLHSAVQVLSTAKRDTIHMYGAHNCEIQAIEALCCLDATNKLSKAALCGLLKAATDTLPTKEMLPLFRLSAVRQLAPAQKIEVILTLSEALLTADNARDKVSFAIFADMLDELVPGISEASRVSLFKALFVLSTQETTRDNRAAWVAFGVMSTPGMADFSTTVLLELLWYVLEEGARDPRLPEKAVVFYLGMLCKWPVAAELGVNSVAQLLQLAQTLLYSRITIDKLLQIKAAQQWTSQ